MRNRNQHPHRNAWRLGLTTVSRGYLPHVEGARFQVVTYRLSDALPRKALEQMKERCGYRKQDRGSQQAGVELTREQALNEAIDQYLDAGYGKCFLRTHSNAQVVVENWFHFHGKLYEVLAFVVMPNHVHVLVQVYGDCLLSKIVQKWKSYTAKKILENEGQIGASEPLAVRGDSSEPLSSRTLWQREYRDRFIRDYEHLMTCIRYIHQNPVKAGLVDRESDWEWCSAHANWKNRVVPVNLKDWVGA